MVYWWIFIIISTTGAGSAGVPDAPAGHGVGFREAVQENRPLPRSRERRDARMRPLVTESVVNLVGENIQIMLDGEINNRL